MKKVIISPAIFNRFPRFVRGIILVKDIQVVEKNKRIKKPLNKIIEQRKVEGNNFVNHPYLKAWDEAHIRFGSDPEQYPPSIKSLLTRIMAGGGLPFINSVVTLFNYISIKYLVPCGGDDIKKISGNLCLDFATGEELFTGLGSMELEHPTRGEVIYYDDKIKQVMCRRWNWRNAEFSKITNDTKEMVINIDGIDGIPSSVVIEAQDELSDLLQEHCAARLTTDLLTSQNQQISLAE
ncbi:MAG: phenylalanine--tRNA ligase beta subunit-related protein [Atribacterota bacterium]|jgi:lysyl-tRNA synthetase class 2|nr:phenylalanine--tRNA ligase beta subunit-related protein [Atribacterota bacterium]MDD4895719.1 phenylalanine--tRNA ligase beta subunit-related protein [Atribacterota bacterium]MDD5637548.1 phenylalanine--tRNA ligase beta subunit-related protein [Atribacterota bacterium]